MLREQKLYEKFSITNFIESSDNAGTQNLPRVIGFAKIPQQDFNQYCNSVRFTIQTKKTTR